MRPRPPSSTLFPYTTLFRSSDWRRVLHHLQCRIHFPDLRRAPGCDLFRCWKPFADRSEEHTSELQSRENLVCRLLLEKKKASPFGPDAIAAPVGDDRISVKN